MDRGDAPGAIIICAIDADADEAVPLSHIFTEAGWGVNRIIVDAGDGAFTALTAMRSARLAVVVWSGASAKSGAMVRIARQADALRKLLAVQIDHAPHPMAHITATDISHWRDRPDIQTRNALLLRAAEMAGIPQAPSPARGLFGLSRTQLSALGAGVAVVAAGALWWAVHSAQERPATVAPDQTVIAETDWKALEKNNVAALRAFLAAHPDSKQADQARLELSRLDASTWVRAESAMGGEDRIVAIDAYLKAFPEGRYAQRARAARAHVAALVRDAQVALHSMGYAPGAVDGAMNAETRHAVAQFQMDQGLDPDGIIDEDLIRALRTDRPKLEPPSILIETK